MQIKTKNKGQKMKNLIQIQVQMLVMGYDYIEVVDKENKEKTGEIHTKLQTLVVNANGVETIKEVKVTKKLEGESLLNKSIEFINVEEFKIGFDTYYRAKDIMEINKIEDNFVVNKSAELNITNASIIEHNNKKQYAIYSTYKDGSKLKSIKIKVKNVGSEASLTKLKGKKVRITDLNVMHIDYKTFYNIDSLKNIALV